MVELADGGMTMVIVTHEMAFARKIAHRMIFMEEAMVIESAPPDAFFDHPQDPRTKRFLGQILDH